MKLYERFSNDIKISMKAGDTARTSTLRMVNARLKDTEIAARPRVPGGPLKVITEDDIVVMLRGMIKSRRESVELYRQGHRLELAAKEEAEIGVIEHYLPVCMDTEGMKSAVDAAVVKTGASSIKDVGKVMAALKAEHGAALDMSQVGGLVKARLS